MILNWYSYVLLCYFLFSIAIFIILFFIMAPYGRYAPKNNTLHNNMLSSRVGWSIMEIPAMTTIFFIVLYYYLTQNNNHLTWKPLVFLGLWEFHYIYRAFIYPHIIPNKKIGMPLLLALGGAFFNFFNGFINAWWLMKIKIYSLSEFTSIHFILGCTLFFTGFFIHAYSDKVMRSLSKSHNYVIPNMFPYNLITAPNYLGEIIQWIGWAIATWSLVGVSFAIFTCANLLPRAISHLKWYRKKFPDYPPNRKAIIPFVL